MAAIRSPDARRFDSIVEYLVFNCVGYAEKENTKMRKRSCLARPLYNIDKPGSTIFINGAGGEEQSGILLTNPVGSDFCSILIINNGYITHVPYARKISIFIEPSSRRLGKNTFTVV